MKVSEVIKAMEQIAPSELCAEWDNSGFLVGDAEAEVTKAYVCLDVAPATVKDAVQKGCNLIVAHHPIIFSGVKRITKEDFTGALLLRLIADGVQVLAAHTNFDSAEKGVNYVLASALGLENIRKMTEDSGNPSYIGVLKEPLTGEALTGKVKEVLGISLVRAAGLRLEKNYRTIAVCGGAGADLWQSARQAGAEALVTADGKHHTGLEAEAAGMAVFDGGHFYTENLAMDFLETYLRELLPDLEIVRSELDTNPWKIY